MARRKRRKGAGIRTRSSKRIKMEVKAEEKEETQEVQVESVEAVETNEDPSLDQIRFRPADGWDLLRNWIEEGHRSGNMESMLPLLQPSSILPAFQEKIVPVLEGIANEETEGGEETKALCVQLIAEWRRILEEKPTTEVSDKGTETEEASEDAATLSPSPEDKSEKRKVYFEATEEKGWWAVTVDGKTEKVQMKDNFWREPLEEKGKSEVEKETQTEEEVKEADTTSTNATETSTSSSAPPEVAPTPKVDERVGKVMVKKKFPNGVKGNKPAKKTLEEVILRQKQKMKERTELAKQGKVDKEVDPFAFKKRNRRLSGGSGESESATMEDVKEEDSEGSQQESNGEGTLAKGKGTVKVYVSEKSRLEAIVKDMEETVPQKVGKRVTPPPQNLKQVPTAGKEAALGVAQPIPTVKSPQAPPPTSKASTAPPTVPSIAKVVVKKEPADKPSRPLVTLKDLAVQPRPPPVVTPPFTQLSLATSKAGGTVPSNALVPLQRKASEEEVRILEYQQPPPWKLYKIAPRQLRNSDKTPPPKRRSRPRPLSAFPTHIFTEDVHGCTKVFNFSRKKKWPQPKFARDNLHSFRIIECSHNLPACSTKPALFVDLTKSPTCVDRDPRTRPPLSSPGSPPGTSPSRDTKPDISQLVSMLSSLPLNLYQAVLQKSASILPPTPTSVFPPLPPEAPGCLMPPPPPPPSTPEPQQNES